MYTQRLSPRELSRDVSDFGINAEQSNYGVMPLLAEPSYLTICSGTAQSAEET